MARARSRIEDHHAEWLSLVETSGPFLTIPTLKRTLPDGLDAAPAALARPADRVRRMAGEPRPPGPLGASGCSQELLELDDAVAEATEADPSHRVAEHNVTLRPTFVVRDRSRDASPAVLLVHAVPSGASLTRPASGDAWSASPIDRAVELARASERPARARHRRRALDARLGARRRDDRHLHLAGEPLARRADHAARVHHAARRSPLLQPARRGGPRRAAAGERRQAAGGRRPARRPGPPRRRAADRHARPRGPRPPRRAARRTSKAPRSTRARSP